MFRNRQTSNARNQPIHIASLASDYKVVLNYIYKKINVENTLIRAVKSDDRRNAERLNATYALRIILLHFFGDAQCWITVTADGVKGWHHRRRPCGRTGKSQTYDRYALTGVLAAKRHNDRCW
jgi:hypothetical protein